MFCFPNKGLRGICSKSGMIFSPNVACFFIGPSLINEVPMKRSILAHFAAEFGSEFWKSENKHGSIWIQNDQELKALFLAEVRGGGEGFFPLI